MNSKRAVQVGDIFATPLPMNKYGAVKVMNIIERSYLLGITNYIGEQMPAIDDQNVCQILITKSLLNEKEESTFKWVDGRLPEELIYIGNIPLAQEELGIESNVDGQRNVEWMFTINGEKKQILKGSKLRCRRK